MPRYGVRYESVRALARECEQLGYTSIWVTDHIQPPAAPLPVLETWTTLTALAKEVKGRIGTMALYYGYRHPAVLASMAATLDDISGGRLELCIGAGAPYQDEECRAMGLPFPKVKVRINELREYVEILRLLLAQSGKVSFEGKYFRLKEAVCNAPTIQKPHPPLWIGGRLPMMLRAIGEMGLDWSYFGQGPEDYARAVRVLEESAKRKGLDPARIRHSIFSGIVLAKERRQFDEALSRSAKARGKTVEEFLAGSYTAIYGTPDECIHLIEAFMKLGVSLFVLRDYDADGGNLKLFGELVLPHFSH